jgi:hypothetical protein
MHGGGQFCNAQRRRGLLWHSEQGTLAPRRRGGQWPEQERLAVGWAELGQLFGGGGGKKKLNKKKREKIDDIE